MRLYRFIIISFVLLNFLNFGNYLYENAAYTNYLGVVSQNFYKYLRLVVLLSALLLLDLRFRTNILQFFRKNQDVLLFIVLSFISTLFSKDFLLSITYTLWTALSLYFILGYLTLIVKSSNEIIFLETAKIFVLSSIAFNVIVILDLPNMLSSGEIFSTYEVEKNNYIYSSVQLLQGLLVFFFLYINKSSQQQRSWTSKLLIIVLITGAAFIIIYSGKRSVLLVSILSVLLLYLSYFKFSVGRFVMISAVLVASYFFYDSVFASAKRTQFRVAKAMDDENQDTSIQARVIIYNNYLEVFKLYPVFGTGLRGGTLISEQINLNQFKSYSFHNTYLAYLVETGIVGFLAFLIIIVRSFYLAFHKLPLSHFLLYLSFALPSVIISISENNALPGQALFWSLWLVLLMPRAFNNYQVNVTTHPKP